MGNQDPMKWKEPAVWNYDQGNRKEHEKPITLGPFDGHLLPQCAKGTYYWHYKDQPSPTFTGKIVYENGIRVAGGCDIHWNNGKVASEMWWENRNGCCILEEPHEGNLYWILRDPIGEPLYYQVNCEWPVAVPVKHCPCCEGSFNIYHIRKQNPWYRVGGRFFDLFECQNNLPTADDELNGRPWYGILFSLVLWLLVIAVIAFLLALGLCPRWVKNTPVYAWLDGFFEDEKPRHGYERIHHQNSMVKVSENL